MTVSRVSKSVDRYSEFVWSGGMFGKHFGSMYEGSMVGAGAVVFAVMGYVIAKQVPDKIVGSQVRLNPLLLSTILGEEPKAIQKAIEYLCAPDPHSTTKLQQGRRLIKIGEFDYQVVTGAKYRAIRDEEERREQNRTAKRRQREKAKLPKSVPQAGEKAYLRVEREEGRDAADAHQSKLQGPEGLLREEPTPYQAEEAAVAK